MAESDHRIYAAEENQLLKTMAQLEYTMQDRLRVEGFSLAPGMGVLNFSRLIATDGHLSILLRNSEKKSVSEIRPLHFVQARLEMEQNLGVEVSARQKSILIRDRDFCHACHRSPSHEQQDVTWLQWMQCTHRLCMTCGGCMYLYQTKLTDKRQGNVTGETTRICPLCWEVAIPMLNEESDVEWN